MIVLFATALPAFANVPGLYCQFSYRVYKYLKSNRLGFITKENLYGFGQTSSGLASLCIRL